MPTTGDIRIRLSTDQRNLLKEKSRLEGYASVSQYIRDKIFGDDLELRRMVQSIYEVVCIRNSYKAIKGKVPLECK